ncbi:MAG: enolase C-terminal domain-like protein [Candidatus Bathyarchaeia archaeon]
MAEGYTIIEEARCRIVFDSRGNETVEVEIDTPGGFGSAAAPAGASKGRWEVVSYPPGGISEAVKRFREQVAPELIGLDTIQQETIDRTLIRIDGTDNFSRIGGNVAYAVSLAVAEAASTSLAIPLFQHLSGALTRRLPFPLGNVLGGGKHAGKGAPDIQEFLVSPLGAKSFREGALANIKVHKTLRSLLEKEDIPFFGGRGDEGAWAPALSNEKAFELVSKAVELVSEEVGFEIRFGVDVASSSLWDEKSGVYVYNHERSKSPGEQIDYILGKISEYKLFYVEDPLHEEDFEGFAELTRKAKDCLICGDDLFVTNVHRLKKGIESKACNALIIKPNQVGTITRSKETVDLAKARGYVPIFSHRSGETTDTHLAHLAIAFGCPLVKTGVLGGERIAKINELLRIEEFLGEEARLAELRIG